VKGELLRGNPDERAEAAGKILLLSKPSVSGVWKGALLSGRGDAVVLLRIAPCFSFGGTAKRRCRAARGIQPA
jgi:hypothetical protein